MQASNTDVLLYGDLRSARLAGASGERGCYTRLADEELLSLVGTGDVSAFTALYKRHTRAVHSLARKLTFNEQDAEDLAQEAYLKVWRSAGSYRAERGGARKWIFCVVRNQNIDLLRSRTSRRKALQKAGAMTPNSPPNDEAFSPVWLESRRERVHEALGELPHAQRTVLALSHFCGLTHAEIADRLCVPLGTVKGRMRLGLDKLRGCSGFRERTLG